jgi:hypothetical protein
MVRFYRGEARTVYYSLPDSFAGGTEFRGADSQSAASAFESTLRAPLIKLRVAWSVGDPVAGSFSLRLAARWAATALACLSGGARRSQSRRSCCRRLVPLHTFSREFVGQALGLRPSGVDPPRTTAAIQPPPPYLQRPPLSTIGPDRPDWGSFRVGDDPDGTAHFGSTRFPAKYPERGVDTLTRRSRIAGVTSGQLDVYPFVVFLQR